MAIHPENAQKIVGVLEEFGFGMPDLSETLFLEEDNIIRMGVPPLRLEILTTISGVQFASCHENRVIDQIDGIEIPIIGLQDLKQNKLASGRHKDLSDLENLP